MERKERTSRGAHSITRSWYFTNLRILVQASCMSSDFPDGFYHYWRTSYWFDWLISVSSGRPTMILYNIDNIRDLFGHKVRGMGLRESPPFSCGQRLFLPPSLHLLTWGRSKLQPWPKGRYVGVCIRLSLRVSKITVPMPYSHDSRSFLLSIVVKLACIHNSVERSLA